MTPIGASTYLWVSPFSDDALHLFGHARELGFDLLEICLEEPGRVTPERVRAAAEEASVGVSVCGAFGPERDVSHEDPVVRRRALDYLRTCIDVAEAVGSRHVVGPMYSATGKTRLLPEGEREQQRRFAVDGLRAVAEYAGERSVALAVEPLNRFETDLVNTVEQGLELCDRIGLPNIGLLLDTFHMNVEERSIPAAIRAAGDRLLHVHACENDRGAPGSGHVDWSGVAEALEAVAYGGSVVIESFTPQVEQIARAASIWRPLGASPDAIAADGLAFLRTLLPVPARART